MKFNKFVAPVMAGALALTLGLAGCGSSSSSETTSSSSEATSSSSEAATTEEDKILFWEGETDKGDVLLYGNDEENGTSTVILFGDHDGNEELLAFNGPATVEGSKVTITDSDTGDAFSYDITDATDDALVVDLGVHGKGTLKPVTEKQFNEEVDKIINTAREIGEQLKTLDEQDVEELLTILQTVLENSSTTNSAQSNK